MSKYPGRIITDLAPAGYSVFFDGTGDYLSVPDNTALEFGSGNFTVEAWVYLNALPSASGFSSILSKWDNSTQKEWWLYFYNNAGTYQLYFSYTTNGSTNINPVANLTGLSVNTWYHVAASRSGTSLYLFINGAQVGSTYNISTDTIYSGTYTPQIGAAAAANVINGYISNARVVKGTALYTAAFTPPTQLLNITNTSLLTCNSPAIIDQSTNAFAITVNGNSAVSTLTPFTAYVPYNPALGASTPGVWTVDEAMQAKATRRWNMYDPYFNLTTLLLHGNGTNAAQNNTFLDSSSNNFTITRNGNTTQGTFSPFSQTGWSNYCSVWTNRLTLSSTSPGNFGSGAFTIEAWVWFDDVGTLRVMASNYQSSTVGWTIYRTAANTITFHASGDGADITSTTTVAAGRWYHIAVSGTPTTPGIRLFINGLQEGSTYTGAVSLDSTNAVVIADGAGGSNAYGLNGYISNLRLVKGTAVYTSNFTPPTQPLTNITNTSLLTCQSNRFIDNSTANSGSGYPITVVGTPSVQPFSPFAPSGAYDVTAVGGSGYFDGTGDYLTWSGSTVGSGAFTFECWFYYTGTFSGIAAFVGPGTAVTNALNLYINNSTQLTFDQYGVTATSFTVPTMVANQWYHVAFVRNSGGSATVFLNGTRSSTGAVSITTNYASIGAIGYVSSAVPRPWIGYLSGVKYSQSAVYDPTQTTITIPTAPPSSSGATLLLNYTNAGIVDSTAKNVLETVGNAQISTTQSKFGGSSMSFDGNGDYLQIPSSNLLAFGSSPYTVELWLYPNNVANLQGLFTMGAFRFFQNTTGLWFLSSSSTIISVATGLSTGQWFHIALVREGTGTNQTKLYLNGSSIGTGTDANTWAAAIAYVGSEAAASYLNGYIDDLRITRGFARYTGNFTPQTSQWQDE